MEPRERFEQNLDEINRIIAFVCRRNHVAPQDCDDFRQHVHLKLLENDCAVLGKFEGRSSFSTYLTTVIQRLFSQYRVQMWGKWRPSATAKRLGDKAITIERMITRDDQSLQDTINLLTTHAAPSYTRAEIEAIYLRLPPRQPRLVLVTETLIPEVADSAAADDEVMRQQRERIGRGMAAVLEPLIDRMTSEDKLIMCMRFWDAAKIPEIAAALHLDEKKLYKRIDHLNLALRKALMEAGFSRDDVADLLAHGDHNLTLHMERRSRVTLRNQTGISVRAQAGGRSDPAD